MSIKYIRYRSYGVKRCGYTDETQPFWTILLSLIFLNEKVRKYQIIAMIVAILGMLFIVKPEFSSTMITSLAGLFSGIFAASAYTCVRALSTREAPYTIVFIFHYFQLSF